MLQFSIYHLTFCILIWLFIVIYFYLIGIASTNWQLASSGLTTLSGELFDEMTCLQRRWLRSQRQSESHARHLGDQLEEFAVEHRQLERTAVSNGAIVAPGRMAFSDEEDEFFDAEDTDGAEATTISSPRVSSSPDVIHVNVRADGLSCPC